MSIGVRHLTILNEFTPFGLTAEAAEGSPSPAAPADYDYFLFDPDVARERDAPDYDFAAPAPSSDRSDQELFIRGNRIIWSAGSQLNKIYTTPNPIIKACWCRMDASSDAFICALQVDTLSIFSISGEVVSVPLIYSIGSIWPLPFGLLLQKSADGIRPVLSAGSLLNSRELRRPSKEHGSDQHGSGGYKYFEPVVKEDEATVSSHLILRHSGEVPKATYIEERGKLSTLKDTDERTIWTSDVIPLMASYQKGKSQHSVWLVGIATNPIADDARSTVDADPSVPFSQQFSFRRIWQGKCSQSAANKVFMATDNDGLAIICLLLGEHNVLVAVRLQIEGRNAAALDIRADISWSISAVAASPVIATRPRSRIGLLPFTDILVLGSENFLLLYSGKQCLCKYLLPTGLRNNLVSHGQQSYEATDLSYVKITGLDNAVEGRINVLTSNGQIFRCTLRRFPSSSLVNDCIETMAEGLHSSIYNHFSLLLWGDRDSSYLSNVDSSVDSEWESFYGSVLKICKKYGSDNVEHPCSLPDTAWQFLINSKFHINYSKQTPSSGKYLVHGLNYTGSVYSAAYIQDGKSREVTFYAQLLRETLDSLHALYENLKLDNLRKRDIELLVVLLYNVAASLGETSYVDYYIRDFPCLFLEVRSFHPNVAPKSPPCLFRWLENCLRNGCHSVNANDLPSLVCNDSSHVLSWARKIVSFYSLLLGGERIGRKLSSGVLCDIAEGSASTPEEVTVLAMVAEKFGRQQLDLLPVGVSLPLRHALDRCRECPPNDWPAAAYVLVGREDLAMACFRSLRKENGSRNSVDLTSISVPYMLHLHPVTTTTPISDTGLNNVKSDDTDSVYRAEDGMEHVFNSGTQLRYGRDLRLNEARRLLSSAKPVAIQSTVNPSGSEQDLQQHQLWNLAQRTTALPVGRGAFTLATTYTLLTEALAVPKLVLAGRLPAQQNAMVNLDPNIRSISELRSWPEFHNGVAAGLRLAPSQGKMSRTWIHYNKPEEPNYTHAGLLLALGLHGHLRVLTITDVYRYLQEQHEITTVGILLGVAASYRGTMHPAISKMLYLHVASRHPSNFAEVELPTLLQSAALMGLGLLYEGSAHPLTMKTLLGEIGRRSGGDNVLEREGYAVAAGSALGLVALGRGKDAFGFVESFVDRLFQYVGGKENSNERYSNMGQTNNDHNHSFGQMMDGAQVNVDVTAPGATIALALIFLKTESEEMASRLYIPVTYYDLQYVRPDFIMLRIIARNLIMWSRICPSRDWIESQIPEIIRVGALSVGDGENDTDEFDAEALVQAYVNIVAGACISLGLKYAGTRNGDAQVLLYDYAVYFLNEIKHVTISSAASMPKGLSCYVDRGTLEISLHLIVLSLCVVMAGSGHLQTFRLLRYLRSRSSLEGHMNYGIQMIVSLAIGFLFLGAGMQTFSTANSAIAALLITLYPRLPTGPSDNRCQLQAFRHLYVIASESRRVQTVDVDTGLPVYAPLEVTIAETENYAETSFCEVTPCILPERSVLKSVRVCGPRYWPQTIQLPTEDKSWWKPGDRGDLFNGGVLYIKRKVGSCSYVDDPVGSQSLLSRAMHKVCNQSEPESSKVDQLISTFSADPSLIAFAQLCCDSSWNNRSDTNFQEFCSQVLFECVSKDKPALLQVYLSLYTMIESMSEQVKSDHLAFHDSLFLSSLKLALAYNESLISGKLACNGGIVKSSFIGSLGKRVEEILRCSQTLSDNCLGYLDKGKWPRGLHGKMEAIHLSWYLQWYGIPPPHVVMSAMERIKVSSSTVPLLRLLLPTTHARAIAEIDKLRLESVRRQ